MRHHHFPHRCGRWSKKGPAHHGKATGMTQASHRNTRKSGLIKLLWTISTLRPEQVAAVAYFVSQLIKEGQR